MAKTFLIDYLPESASRYRDECAVVAVDVVRATTMAITAVATGRKCYPVDSLDAAFELAQTLRNPILAGEIDGEPNPQLEMGNSPAELARRLDTSRPLILLSTSGTSLIMNARGCAALYLACFRNSLSMGCRLINEQHPRIALLGAGSRGEFREEGPNLLRLDRGAACPRRLCRREQRNGHDPGPLVERPARGLPRQPEHRLSKKDGPAGGPALYSGEN